MPIIDPNNPLSAIGASNDQSLVQRTTDNNKLAGLLGNSLATIAATGGQDRQTAGLNNRSLEARTGATNLAGRQNNAVNNGLNFDSPTYPSDLRDRNAAIALNRNVTTAGNAYQDLGIKNRNLPGPNDTLTTLTDPSQIQQLSIPGKQQNALATVPPEVKQKKGVEIKLVKTLGPDGQDLGFPEETITKFFDQTVTDETGMSPEESLAAMEAAVAQGGQGVSLVETRKIPISKGVYDIELTFLTPTGESFKKYVEVGQID